MQSSAFVFVGLVFCSLASVFFSGFSECGGCVWPFLLACSVGVGDWDKALSLGKEVRSRRSMGPLELVDRVEKRPQLVLS